LSPPGTAMARPLSLSPSTSVDLTIFLQLFSRSIDVTSTDLLSAKEKTNKVHCCDIVVLIVVLMFLMREGLQCRISRPILKNCLMRLWNVINQLTFVFPFGETRSINDVSWPREYNHVTPLLSTFLSPDLCPGVFNRSLLLWRCGDHCSVVTSHRECASEFYFFFLSIQSVVSFSPQFFI